MKFRANQVTPAGGGWRLLSASVAQWPAAAEFLRQRAEAKMRIGPIHRRNDDA